MKLVNIVYQLKAGHADIVLCILFKMGPSFLKVCKLILVI